MKREVDIVELIGVGGAVIAMIGLVVVMILGVLKGPC
jgi:hypothetical protein